MAQRRLFGGIARITFQMSSIWDTAATRRSIDLLGTQVAPLVRQGIADRG